MTKKRKARRRGRFVRLLMLAGLVAVVGFLFMRSDWLGQVTHPIYYKDEIRRYAAQYEVDAHLIAAIIRVESNFDPKAVSRKGAAGIMQLMPDTAEWILSKDDFGNVTFKDASRNADAGIRLGTWYVKELSRQFEGDRVKLVAAYNAGPGKVRQWLNEGVWDGARETISNIPYGETRHYVQRVLYYYNKYQTLYNPL